MFRGLAVSRRGVAAPQPPPKSLEHFLNSSIDGGRFTFAPPLWTANQRWPSPHHPPRCRLGLLMFGSRACQISGSCLWAFSRARMSSCWAPRSIGCGHSTRRPVFRSSFNQSTRLIARSAEFGVRFSRSAGLALFGMLGPRRRLAHEPCSVFASRSRRSNSSSCRGADQERSPARASTSAHALSTALPCW
jgi:hypothetical protein